MPCSRRELGDDARDARQHVHVLVPVEVADGDAGVTHARGAARRARGEPRRSEIAAAQPPARAAASRAARNRPSGSTRLAAAAAPTSGRCSVSTRWTPTARPGRLRASATACSNAGPVAMIDVDVTMPRSCASTMPRFTASAIPKSSALTMSFERRRSSPLRERPVLHAEIVRREDRERQRQPHGERRKAGPVDEQRTRSAVLADERRSVQHARTCNACAATWPSARNVQSGSARSC